jgi:hypothetical protein
MIASLVKKVISASPHGRGANANIRVAARPAAGCKPGIGVPAALPSANGDRHDLRRCSIDGNRGDRDRNSGVQQQRPRTASTKCHLVIKALRMSSFSNEPPETVTAAFFPVPGYARFGTMCVNS